MIIVDTFHFNNEMEMLDLRVKILEDVVDVFIIKEASETFRGGKKRCLANTYKHSKINVQTVTFPSDLTPWQRDMHQKTAHVELTGVNDDDDAIIMMSDVDEVPDPDAISRIMSDFDPTVIYALQQRMFQGYLNVMNLNQRWTGTQLCSIKTYKKMKIGPLEQRNIPYARVKNAGWHWSFLGGMDVVKDKLQSFAHEEYDNEETFSQLQARLDRNEDIIGRGFRLATVPIDDTFPPYVIANESILRQRGLIR